MPLSTNATTTRHGFTLVELLVVIAIIAVLVSLTLAGVQRVRILGPKTENAARITQIHDAIGRCKADLKLDYIPSQVISGTGFTLKSSYTGTEPELDILLRAFPNMNTVANPNPQNGDTSNGYTGATVVLDPNQTLCFFLTGGGATSFSGFSTNPRKPFLGVSTTGETRKGPWIEPNNKFFGSVTGGQPWLLDVYGTPYAYFASVGAKQNLYGVQSYNPTSSGFVTPTGVPAPGATAPYANAGKFFNESSFQIISAGRNRQFGSGGTLPAGMPGEDDQSNFSAALLGAP